MYTQCPECRTIFEIDEEALQASFGIVHCGHCAKRFDALRTLSNTLPLEPGAGLPALPDALRIPTLTAEVPAAAVAAAHRRYPRRPLDDDAPATPDAPDAAAVLVGDDDWFDALQADLAAELDPDAPAKDPPPAPIAAADERPVPGATLDVGSIPVTGPAPGAAGVLDGAYATTDVRAPQDAAIAPAAEAAVDPVPDDAFAAEPRDGTEDAPIDSAALGLRTADAAPAHATSAPVGADTLPPAPIDAAAPSSTPALEPAAKRALEAASDPEPTAPDADAEAHPQAPVAAGSDPAPEPSARADAGPTPTPADEPAPPPDPASLHDHVTMYVRPLRPRRDRSALAWALSCAALALLLALQVVWAERVRLYLAPASHGWMSRVCSALPCRLPPLRESAKLTLVSRDIRPDPRRPGALSITATLRNDAGFREAWPVVSVVLTDIDNQPVAMRRFRPAEYLPDRARRDAGIAPGATVAVAFEVADPGQQARGFQFAFE